MSVHLEGISSAEKRKLHLDDDVIFFLSLPCNLIIEWNNKLREKKANSYLEQLNKLVDHIKIKDCKNRLEGRIRRKAGEIKTEMRSKKKRKTITLEKMVRFTVKEDEVKELELQAENKHRLVLTDRYSLIAYILETTSQLVTKEKGYTKWERDRGAES